MSGAGGRRPVNDAHLHVIDPRFPLVANDGYLPEPFTVADYRTRTAHLAVAGGAVVSGSFQAFRREDIAVEQIRSLAVVWGVGNGIAVIAVAVALLLTSWRARLLDAAYVQLVNEDAGAGHRNRTPTA